MKVLTFLIIILFSHLQGNPMVQKFTNARILIDHQLVQGELWIAEGKIVPAQGRYDVAFDMQQRIIAPGYIDIQINGAFGCDFSRNPELIEDAARQLPAYGITSFCPTVISSAPERYRQAIPFLQPRCIQGGATILGIHLEGPYFAKKYAGAHNPEFLQPATASPFEIYGSLQGVRLVTLAPELPGALELVKSLKGLGILVSAGHSAANGCDIQKGIAAGIGMATHLFNAMAPFHHRDSGIIGAALASSQLPYSIIVDGCHVTGDTVAMCWKCNKEGMILISDATEALGLPEGRYQLGTLDIDLVGDHIYLTGTKTLAGSNLRMDKAVRLLKKYTGCSTVEALEAASLKPAKLLGVYPAKGCLETACDADFVVLNDDLEIEACYIAGEQVFATTQAGF